MLLIVGLGNPGTRYLLTRHNIGFMALDQFIKGVGVLPSKEEFDGITCRFTLDDKDVLFVKPMNYMNNSGETVAGLVNFYKIAHSEILVVHDDIDQPFGGIKFQQNRGAGGHNGIKSISEKLGSQDYVRLKLGVSRPSIPNMEVADWVLQKFGDDDQEARCPYRLHRPQQLQRGEQPRDDQHGQDRNVTAQQKEDRLRRVAA